jgi:hypothetical protein
MRDIDWFKRRGYLLCYGLHVALLKVFAKKVMVWLANLRARLQLALHPGI